MIREKMDALAGRLEELERQMSDPEVIRRQERYRALAREHAGLRDALARYGEYTRVERELEGSRRILDDPASDEELKALAEGGCRGARGAAEASRGGAPAFPPAARQGRRPRYDRRDQAGTGGEEAALFVADLFRMYSRYAERMGWRVETMDSHPTGLGGSAEIIFSVEGRDVFRSLKYESGVHRVQRVPATEGAGRIHTSAATVAVLPEAEEVEVAIDPADVRGRLPLPRPRRAEREHDRLGRSPHLHPHRARRDLPGREVAAQEQGQGDAGAPGAPRRRRWTRSASASSPRSDVPRSPPATGARRSAPITSPRTG